MSKSVLLSIEEAGKALGISRSTVYLLLAENALVSVKLRRRRLVTVASVEALAVSASKPAA